MHDVLPPWHLLTAFIAASIALAVTPGPGVLYIVTRSLTQGRRDGLASVAGVAIGNLGNATAAVLGLAALFAISSTAFAIVRYAGAAYLVYLGLRALRSPPAGPGQGPRPSGTRRAFYDGLLVALLNPKTTIFFAAFLPQFMGLDASPVIQGLGLGALFVAIAALTDSVYAFASGAVAPLLLRAKRIRSAGRYLSGGTFIGLGLFTAFAGGRVST